MNRPLYETENDLAAERAVATDLEKLWDVTLHKLEIEDRIDFRAERSGSLVGWIEVKCRDVHRTTYPTLILSREKVIAGDQLRRRTGMPFLIVVKWNDGLFVHRFALSDITDSGMGGRVDRGDPQDIEKVIHFPVEGFIPVGGIKL